jgi:hypothetical protein
MASSGSDNMMSASRASPGRPSPEAGFGKPSPLRKIGSATAVHEAMHPSNKKEWQPIFSRNSMTHEIVEPFGMSIKNKIQYLDDRLAQNKEWMGVECTELFKLIALIRAIVAKVREKEERPHVEDLKERYQNATALISAKYENMVNLMRGVCDDDDEKQFMESRESWDDIIAVCKCIEVPNWKCLQSSTLIVPLYTDALCLHDDLYLKCDGASSLREIDEGMTVSRITKDGSPRFGTVTQKHRDGNVTVSWPEKKGW